MKSVDKYVYPDTNILINKFDCRDADKLREIEALSTGGNLAYLHLHPIRGNFDFKHLKDIHHLEMLEVSIQSFNIGNNDGFVSIFGRNIIPIDEYKEYQSRLS